MAVRKISISNGFTGKIAAAAFLLLGFQVLTESCGAGPASPEEQQTTLGGALLQELADAAGRSLCGIYMPSISLSQESGYETYWLLQEQIDSVLPFYGYLMNDLGGTGQAGNTLREILLAEALEGSESSENSSDSSQLSILGSQTLSGESLGQGAAGQTASLEELLRAENEAAQQMQQERPTYQFTPHTQQVQVDMEALASYETLVRDFYTIDANTMAGSDQLNVSSLLSKDMTITKDDQGPQILIYHTHSQEDFADSVPGDDSTTIQGVGEYLAWILQEEYGYQVLHHTGEYDVETRDDAYANSLPAIQQILAENPTIQVVIDLHRDQMPEETRLVMDLDGRPTARFMFFNGLSRTKTTGNIAYLYNENLDDNLAFSFQMQLKAAEYYPGLTRKIYLKGYRYNMHLKPRYLLIELGAQNNTLEEAMNACDPLAHILDMVLSGE